MILKNVFYYIFLPDTMKFIEEYNGYIFTVELDEIDEIMTDDNKILSKQIVNHIKSPLSSPAYEIFIISRT